MSPRIRRLMRRLTADKRKLGVMLGLAAVSLLLWGRLILKDVPRTVSANDWAAASSDPFGGPRETVYLDLPPDLKRNLFVFDPKPYKRTKSEEDDPDGPKTQDPAADESARRAAIVKDARELRLASVVSGSKPHAMINGLLVMPGQKIEGFTLLQVSERTVMLEKDGIRIRLRM